MWEARGGRKSEVRGVVVNSEVGGTRVSGGENVAGGSPNCGENVAGGPIVAVLLWRAVRPTGE